MDSLQRHLRSHLVGTAAAIALLGRGEMLRDPAARSIVRRLREELRQEQRAQTQVAQHLNVRVPIPFMTVARIVERLARWAPGRRAVVRTPLCDVIDLEAMRDAIAAKTARCEALLESGRMPPGVAEYWRDEGRLQQAALDLLHADASGRAFAG